MGQVFVNILVGHQDGGEMTPISDVLVDTGSVHTTLPTKILGDLHITPNDYVTVEFANREQADWAVGQARIQIQGSDKIWTCPIYFSPDEGEFLLGATTLEIFGLMVDPLEHGLIPKTIRARSI